MAPRTYRVFFKQSAHYDTRSVELLADWTGWKKGALPLEDADGDNVWHTAVDLPSGVYHYKFLVDGHEYKLDANLPEKELDAEGNWNTVLRVGDARWQGDVLLEPNAEDTVGPKVVRIRAAYDRRKFASASLVATINDQPVIVPGVTLFEDEVYAWTVFRVEHVHDLTQFLYYIELRNPGSLSYYGQSGMSGSEWEVDSFEYRRPPVTPHAPDWVSGSVFYQIFPDRFANGDTASDPEGSLPPDALPRSDSFYGGDLEGVAQKAEYLADLGVNTVYLTPIFESRSPHKYDTADYRKVDPHFGGETAFDHMADALKGKNLRFIVDGVFNHSGTDFWAFRDIQEKGPSSKYLDWYRVHKFPLIEAGKPNYDCWWNFPSMPEFNEGNPEVTEYLLGSAEYWIKRGASGWRLDVPNEVDHPFWKLFRQRVRSANPDAYLLGEIWNDGREWLKGDEFDGVMNYIFREACIDFFAMRKSGAEHFARTVGKQLYDYPLSASFSALNFLSTHDTARFFTIAGKDMRRVRLAAAFLFTALGAPCIYYGDEVGMEGGKDPDNRRFMQWDESRQNREIFDTYRQLARIRRENPVLSTGEMRFVHAEDGLIGYERYNAEDRLLVFINNSGGNAHIDVTRFFGNGDFADLARGADLKRKKAFTLGANEFVILRKTKDR